MDYIEAARADGNLKVLGISEHAPVHGDYYYFNMKYSDLDAYTKAVKEAKEDVKDIKVFLGTECDFEKEHLSYYKEEFLGRCGFDYLLCSVHMFRDRAGEIQSVSRSKDFLPFLRDYVDNYTTALSSGMFLFGCHPDLYFASLKNWGPDVQAASKDIISCAIDNHVPLEINGAGRRKAAIETAIGMRQPYSVEEFYIMAKDMGCMICCNSDAHKPNLVHGQKVEGHLNECYEMADRLGIEFVDWEIGDDGKIRPVSK